MVSAKIAGRTYERLEDYAEEQEISRSQAIDYMLKQGLDVEESDMRLVPVRADGGTKIENQLEAVQTSIESQSDQIKAYREWNDVLTLGIISGLIWIWIQIQYDIGTVFTVLTGTGLMIALAYTYYRIQDYNV